MNCRALDWLKVQIRECKESKAVKLLEDVSVWCTTIEKKRLAMDFYLDFPEPTIGELNWALKQLEDKGEIRCKIEKGTTGHVAAHVVEIHRE